MTSILDVIHTLAEAATATGVIIAGWQLHLAKQQATTSFEDQLAAQYREIARKLPIEAMLGSPLDAEAQEKALSDFYHYFDLSNEQAFLFKRGRVQKATWDDWKEGIEQDFQRPAFRQAWKEVSVRAPQNFNDLRAWVPRADLSSTEELN